jgi:hypothetical protein
MDTYILNGWNPETNNYTNPLTGLVENCPSEPIIYSATPVNGYHIYSEISPDKLRTEREFELYKQRKLDGENAFLRMAAKLRIAKLNGVIDENTFQSIEDTLEPVRREVVEGQWKSGLIKLLLINPASVGQSLYDEIKTDLTDYIAQSYV